MANHRANRSGQSADPDRVAVLLPLPIAGPYDYRVPRELSVLDGSIVRVPLGARETTGVVWGPATGEVEDAKLRDIAGVHDIPPMTEAMRRFVDWVARYTLYRPGAVLKMALSVPEALDPPRPMTVYGLAHEPPPDGFRMTPARRKVLDALAHGPAMTGPDLARAAGVGPAVVKGLAQAGVVEPHSILPRLALDPPDLAMPGMALSTDQSGAAQRLRRHVGAGRFAVAVLDGVTGSGKTEVYFEAMAEALGRGRQVLVMLPEIALGVQWLDRFVDRFGARPAEWHSDVTQARRRATWRAVASGEVRVVVGARSALFLPFRELGLIVVDEEHDASYKQEDGVVYHARDMAIVRAQLEAVPAVLVSATPSLETMTNVARGKYDRIHLPERHGQARMPAVTIVDLRRDPPPRQAWLSPVLRQALAATLDAGEQAMLFLNRRGYAPLTLCRTCGFRLHCPRCTAWLVEHRLTVRLECHHCGYATGRPDACPDCGSDGGFAVCGPGVERIAEEVAGLLPSARVAVLTSDTIHGPTQAADAIHRITDHEVDLIIGTQIVAKGHHFPMLTMVGVVDADLGLAGGDLRAAERTYQLLYQVAGRAGRADRPGRVILQSYLPEHPVLQALASGDRDAFLAAEGEARRVQGWPPYGKLAALIVSGRREDRVEQAARALGAAAPRGDGVLALGPAPAPLARLRGAHRRRLLLKTVPEANLQAILRGWLAAVETPAGVRVQVDVNPYSFL